MHHDWGQCRGVGECIDIEYNKCLDRRQPCLEDELNGGSNNIVQSNKISLTPVINLLVAHYIV